MHDIIILKAADDVDDSINLADMSKEFIPETLAAVCAANKTRYNLIVAGTRLFG